MSDAKALAQAAKGRGNVAFAAQNFPVAITEFTEAIRQDPTDHVFFSNRSGAYTSLQQFDQALADAESCIKLKPDWVKGYSRKGAALHGAGRLREAAAAFDEGLKKEPKNAQLLEGLEAVKKDVEAASASNPFAKIFGPAMWTKLEANPNTARLLATDPSFRSKMQLLQTNPQLANTLIQSDPQVQQALSVILGLGDGKEGEGAEGEAASAPGTGGAGAGAGAGAGTGTAAKKSESRVSDGDDEDEEEAPRPPPKRAAPAAAKREEKKAEAKSDETPEQKAAREKLALSEAEKKKGNDAYAKKDLSTALTLYTSAIEIDSTNASAYLNAAAVHLERKEYDRAVELCRKSIEIARDNTRGFEVVGKAYLRMGNAFMQQKRYEEAAEAFQKSLLEETSDKAKDGLRKATDLKQKAAREAYIDPAKSVEAKTRGNEFFREGKWVEAISEYDEAIKRDPSNPANYSNRAACFQKLMDWGRAIEDCETSLKLDNTFVKAYVRLGKIQHFLKQYHKAIATFDKGLLVAPEGGKAELLESKALTSLAISQENRSGNVDPARAREAMKDPEIQAILKDPTINKVLQDMQAGGAGSQSALADPDIRSKIEKLIAAGILQVGGRPPAGGRGRGGDDE